MSDHAVDPAGLLGSAAAGPGSLGGLAGQILARTEADPSCRVRLGVCTDFDFTTMRASVKLAGDTTATAGVPVIRDVALAVDDAVYLLQQGPTLLVIGVAGAPGANDLAQHLYTTGAWSTSAQPSGTSGLGFTISRAGNYQLTQDMTGWSPTAATNQTGYAYLDGALKSSRLFAFNPSATHLLLPAMMWEQYLSAGTHYWWVRFSGASDDNDSATLTLRRV